MILLKQDLNIFDRSKGFTLIETMVSIAVGLFVLAGVTFVAASVLRANTGVLKSTHLNQGLGTVMQVMIDEIRRAGYNQCEDDPITANNECCIDPAKVPCPKEQREDLIYKDATASQHSEDLYIENSGSCILYSYNRNSDDTKDANERNGFKLENDQLKVRTSCGANSSFNSTIDACATDCSLGSWESLSDDNTNNVLTVTSLAFSATGSKCKEITRKANKIPGSKDDNYWITTGDTTNFPCLATNGSNLTTYVLNAPPPPRIYAPGTYIAPTAETPPDPPYTGDKTVETRQVTATLEGKVKQPSQFGNTASIKKLDVSIKIRNDRIRTH